jgi:hypothetical protein
MMLNTDEKRAISEARKRRAEEAQRVWDMPIVQESLNSMERDIIRTMKALKPNDNEGRDACWRELRALEIHRKKFLDYLTTGEAARSFLQTLKDRV